MRWFLIIALSTSAWAQTAPFAPAEDISFRRANIISEGTRMSAEVFAPKASADKKLSTILMAQGWGDSDSRVILTAPEPREHPNGRFTAEVQEVREVVDPMDEVTDWFNAIAWLQAEPPFD